MRQHLIEYEQYQLQGTKTEEQIGRDRDECRKILKFYGWAISFISILQMFVSGMAIAYLVIITSQPNFGNFCRFFFKLSLAADIFFYIISFVIFLSLFQFTLVLYQIHWTKKSVFSMMIIIIIIIILNMFMNTFNIPMSIYVKRTINEYGDWFSLLEKSSKAYNLIYLVHRSFIIIRMIILIITGPICSFIISVYRPIAWAEVLYHR